MRCLVATLAVGSHELRIPDTLSAVRIEEFDALLREGTVRVLCENPSQRTPTHTKRISRKRLQPLLLGETSRSRSTARTRS